MHLSLTAILAAGAIAFAGTAVSRRAEACGGTFCDNGPRAMPVNQTGENILFVMTAGMVEAHIQIQYKGEAAKFSWILPVQALPEVEVGAEALFGRLLQATVPTFGTTTQYDFCGDRGGQSATGSAGVTAGGFPGPPANGT